MKKQLVDERKKLLVSVGNVFEGPNHLFPSSTWHVCNGMNYNINDG